MVCGIRYQEPAHLGFVRPGDPEEDEGWTLSLF